MKKLRIYKVLLLFLILAISVITTMILIKVIKLNSNENSLKSVVANIYDESGSITKNDAQEDMSVGSVDEIKAEVEGNKVVGIIKIPKINIEYPILENTTVETLNFSITKFWGNKINEIGNVSLAGHNRLNGTMFGKLKKLVEGDIIELTDIQKVVIQYKVYKTYITDPNDISCITPENENVRELTLITCTNGNKNRLIVKAMEI